MTKPYAQILMERNEEDLRSLLKETWGQRFISQLLYDCGVYGSSVNFDNDRITYFNEGRRSVGNALLEKVLRINPDAYRAMKRMDKEDYDVGQQDAERRRMETA